MLISRRVVYCSKVQTLWLCFLHQSFVLDHLCELISLLIAYKRYYLASTWPSLDDFVSPACVVLGSPYVWIWFRVARTCWFLAVSVGFDFVSHAHAGSWLSLWDSFSLQAIMPSAFSCGVHACCFTFILVVYCGPCFPSSHHDFDFFGQGNGRVRLFMM